MTTLASHVSAPACRRAADGSYTMGRSAEEHERLRRQARDLEEPTARLLDRVGVTAGARCLDVGCGAGDVMRLLAERVGGTGTVTGIDLDGPLGREALASLQARGHRNCRFVEGDILETELPAGPGFDVVFARLVLIHADRPLSLIATMWRHTAPGGVLVVQDYDLDAIASHPAHPVVDEFRRVFLAVFRHAGRPQNAGTRLWRQFAAAGPGDPDDTVVDGRVAAMAEARPMIEAVYRSVLPLALEWGITNPAATDEWLADLADAPADLTVRYPMLVGAWRRRPSLQAVT